MNAATSPSTVSPSTSSLKAFKVVDPVTDLGKDKKLAIFQGGKQVNVVANISTSFSNSSVTFSAPPPNPGTIIDRIVWLGLPIELTFTGTAPLGRVGQPFLRIGSHDGFRAFPLQSCITNTTVTFNNTSVSINSSDVIPDILRYNTDMFDEDFVYDCPAMQDPGYDYSDWIGSNRNPLLGVNNGATHWERPRGCFPLGVSGNNIIQAGGVTAASPNQPKVYAYIVEPIILSPLVYQRLREGGLTGLQTLQFVFTMGQPSRMWSHSNDDELGGQTQLITGLSMAISSANAPANLDYLLTPRLFFRYITPQLTNIPPSINVYNYYQVDRYPTDYPAVAAGAVVTLVSNNIQLNSIPNCIYLFARDNNASKDIVTGCSVGNAFTYIQNVSINWNNNAGLLSSATSLDLYHIAKKNGLRMTYEEWFGSAPNPNLLAGQGIPTNITTTGGILRLVFGEDIGLNENEAPGLLGTYQLQINMTIRNHTTVQRNLAFYVVVVSQGIITIGENRSVTQIGIISADQILNSGSFPTANFQELQSIYGGNIWDSIKGFFSNVKSGIREAAPVAKTLWKAAKAAAPIVAPLVGLGLPGQQQQEQGDDAMDEEDYQGTGPALNDLRGSGLANPSSLFPKKRKL
jgi:hypothetical protein